MNPCRNFLKSSDGKNQLRLIDQLKIPTGKFVAGGLQTARAAFTKLLWLNPYDNQGVRFLLAAIDNGKSWHQMIGNLIFRL